MNLPFVSLRPEITRTDALILMTWMGDDRVTRYLTDSASVTRLIGQTIDRTQMPIMTQLFNQGGRFFMVYDRRDTPVGFVRLAKTGRDYEIVLVIGDHDNWGRRLGSSTIREVLKLAFFDMRAGNVIAKIHSGNVRSMSAFEHSGFVPGIATSTFTSLAIAAGRYRRLLREGAICEVGDISMTELDQSRLHELIELEEGPASAELEHEIERAVVVSHERIAEDIVTMNSKVTLRIDEEQREVSLVYPKDANESAGRVSVLSQIGAAILGYREGDAVDQFVSDRTRRILIDKVTYQPEARGDFHL